MNPATAILTAPTGMTIISARSTTKLVLPLPSLIQALPEPIAELFRHSGRRGLDWLLDYRLCPNCKRPQIQGNALWTWLQNHSESSPFEGPVGLDCLDCRRPLGVWSLKGLEAALTQL